MAITSNSLTSKESIEKSGTLTRQTETKPFEIERKNIIYIFIHDMKNSVIAAEGFLLRLISGKNGSLTETQINYLELIRDNINKLEKLIIQLLDFLKFEAKEYRPVLNPLNIITTVSKCIGDLKIIADKKNVRIFFDHHENPGTVTSVIYADSMMIKQVIMNLLDNAIKYTHPDGNVTVKVLDRDEDVFIQIKDTGIGISEDHIPHVFDPFYRVHGDAEGSGLGLFIAKTIVDAHGGIIWAEGIKGEGSSFSFTLPKNHIKRRCS